MSSMNKNDDDFKNENLKGVSLINILSFIINFLIDMYTELDLNNSNKKIIINRLLIENKDEKFIQKLEDLFQLFEKFKTYDFTFQFEKSYYNNKPKKNILLCDANIKLLMTTFLSKITYVTQKTFNEIPDEDTWLLNPYYIKIDKEIKDEFIEYASNLAEFYKYFKKEIPVFIDNYHKIIDIANEEYAQRVKLIKEERFKNKSKN